MGFTPARLANAASERTRPGCDHAARATAAVTGPMPGWSSSTRAGLALRRLVICLVLAASSRSVAITRLASRDSLPAGHRGCEVFGPGAPSGYGGDLSGGEGSAGVDPQVGHPDDCGQGVDRSGPLAADVITRGDQHPHGGPDAVVRAGSTQHRHVDGQDGLGDAAGIQRVGLADSAVGAGVHPAGLGDGVSGVVGDTGQPGAVGPHALDHPQHIEIAAGAAGDPRDCSL